MGWNYRVMRHRDAKGRTWLAVHEAFYDDQGEVTAWTDEAVSLVAEDLEALRWDVEALTRALDYPVVEVPHNSVQNGAVPVD